MPVSHFRGPGRARHTHLNSVVLSAEEPDESDSYVGLQVTTTCPLVSLQLHSV